MSGASAPPEPQTGRPAGATVPGAEVDLCPLCGSPLHPDQDWCLRCGAAARTRLAASSNWKAPIIAVAVVAALALAVLAASLVKLAGGPSSTTDITRTIVGGPASVTSPGTATPTPAPSARPPSARPPAASAPAASSPATAPAVTLAPATMVSSSTATLNGAVNPQGVPTTWQYHVRKTASQSWAGAGAPSPPNTSTAVVGVFSRIAFLTPGTTYHYMLTASKAGRVVSTPEATFTTRR